MCWCHCGKNAQFSIFLNRHKDRRELSALNPEVKLLDAPNMWSASPTARPSLTHVIKVIIVLVVLLLSPAVREAGLGSGRTLIGRDDPCVTVLPF